MLDVFNQDAFSIVSLTDAINKVKFVPGRVSAMGLFAETSISTTTIAIEQKGGILTLVTPTPRGGPGITLDKQLRDLRSVVVPHFEINDAVYAEEVQGIRSFGSETTTETVMGKVAERLQIHAQSHAATQEYARVGAIKGVIAYAGGSTLDLFSLFGISQDAEIAMDLSGTTAGALRKKAAAIIRQLASNLDGVPFTGVHVLCSDSFFDDLLANTEVRASYLQQQEASELRNGYVQAGQSFGTFSFGGIIWENYRGSVGGQAFITADKAHAFPLGVPGLFKTAYAPADYVETVNTNGLPMYAKQYEMPNGKGIHLDTQKNSLEYCTRPNALLKLKKGT